MRSGTTVSTEAERTTLKEALERYLREVTPTKKGRAREERRVKAQKTHLEAAECRDKKRRT